jgi:hypothetical protein
MPGLALKAPLPLTAAERGIERTASQTLVTTYAFTGKTIRARIKSLEALDAFYATNAALYTRNHAATTAAIAALAAGTETGAGAGNGMRNAANRKPAGAKAKPKSRGAGA